MLLSLLKCVQNDLSLEALRFVGFAGFSLGAKSSKGFTVERSKQRFAMNPKGSRGALFFCFQLTNASSLDEGDCMVLHSVQRLRWFSPKFHDPAVTHIIISNRHFYLEISLVWRIKWMHSGVSKANQGWNVFNCCELTWICHVAYGRSWIDTTTPSFCCLPPGISSLWSVLLDLSVCSWGQLGRPRHEMVCDVPHEWTHQSVRHEQCWFPWESCLLQSSRNVLGTVKVW